MAACRLLALIGSSCRRLARPLLRDKRPKSLVPCLHSFDLLPDLGVVDAMWRALARRRIMAASSSPCPHPPPPESRLVAPVFVEPGTRTSLGTPSRFVAPPRAPLACTR